MGVDQHGFRVVTTPVLDSAKIIQEVHRTENGNVMDTILRQVMDTREKQTRQALTKENMTLQSSRDDMMDLYQAIEKAGKWDDFDNYSWNYRKGVKPEISHTTWLFCLSGEGYEDRCKMVAEFWGENESTPSR